MPISPKGNESQDDFVSRCIAHEVKQGYEQDQASAICYEKWRAAKKSQMLAKVKKIKKSLLPMLQRTRDQIKDEIRKEMEESGKTFLSGSQLNKVSKNLGMEKNDLIRFVKTVRRAIEKERRGDAELYVQAGLKENPKPTFELKKEWAEEVGINFKELDDIIYSIGQWREGDPEKSPEKEELSKE